MPSSPAKPLESIRVGMIAMTDLDDPNPISGMPYRMAESLRHQGVEIVPIPAWESAPEQGSVGRRASNRIVQIHHRRTPMWIRRAHDNLRPGATRAKVFRRVTRLSGLAQSNLDALIESGVQLDALFGCCISSAMYALETDIPMVYFSDATSKIIQKTYPMLALRGDAFREALYEVEKVSVAKTWAAVFAAPSTQKSAIDDLGIEPEKTSVVAMGAHVVPGVDEVIESPASCPTRSSCRILIVAADPVRKRVDLATRATEILCERGIDAKLSVIGKGTKVSRGSHAVESVGPLRLSDPDDRTRHQKLLRECHIQFLPSLGEAFGIAPCESAHYARPSIVAGAGGLSFVIRDGQTGIVLDVDADAKAWADAAESWIDDPERYRAMSIAGLERARDELNWDAWGASLRRILDEQIQIHRQG
jgi:glycosyltransferase involved in cell wall biosynthesis